MSTILYWFSGTGNSLHLGRRIAQRLGEAELVPIARALQDEAPPRLAERVGLIFPVYAWGPPRAVERFIARLPAGGEAYLFAAFTYAGSAGSAAKVTRRLLLRGGLDLAAAWGVRMVENYPPMGGAPAPEKQQRICAEAEPRIDAVVEEIAAFPRGHYHAGSAFFNLAGPTIHRLFLTRVATADRKFHADDSCVHCGLCERVCPVADIELVEGKPRWKGRCEQCYACFHFCPAQAIQRGPKTKSQPRYHHPCVNANDLIVRENA